MNGITKQIEFEISQACRTWDGDRINQLTNELARTMDYQAHPELVSMSKTHSKHGPTRGTIRTTPTGSCVTEGMSRDITRSKYHKTGGSGRRSPKYMSSKQVDWEDELENWDYELDEDAKTDPLLRPKVYEPVPEWARRYTKMGWYTSWDENGKFVGVY